MEYQLIALDMDGTLLDSQKRVLPSSTAAINEAVAAGKVVAISSGRCPVMIEMDRAAFPQVRYAICGSGSAIYDFHEQRMLKEATLDHTLLETAIAACSGEDYLCEAFSGTSFFFASDMVERMPNYFMGIYQPLYASMGTPRADFAERLHDPAFPVQKFNLHFGSPEARDRVYERLSGAPLELAYMDEASLELSPIGVNKGSGVLALAELLGVPREATMAVGDSDNDLTMLREVGLGVAMGNANENARAAASVQVADNDHDGVAEAIRRFLLGEGNASGEGDGRA